MVEETEWAWSSGRGLIAAAKEEWKKIALEMFQKALHFLLSILRSVRCALRSLQLPTARLQ